jgi:hypothetical protein
MLKTNASFLLFFCVQRLNEINAQYQEKLLALRARQATYREEFLRKESQARQQQYQQASMSSYANNVRPGETHGYTPIAAKPPPPPPAAAATAGDGFWTKGVKLLIA